MRFVSAVELRCATFKHGLFWIVKESSGSIGKVWAVCCVLVRIGCFGFCMAGKVRLVEFS